MQESKNSKDGSPGPDGMYSQFLKHLPEASLELLVNIFNLIWTTDYFPSTWQQTVVIPIAKGKKDQADPNNLSSNNPHLHIVQSV